MTAKEETIKNELLSQFADKIREIVIKRPRRIFVTAEDGKHTEVIRYLHAHCGMTHVSTITGKDLGENLEVLYHMNDGSLCLTVRVQVPKSDPRIPSLMDLFPGVIFYEKELESLFGFRVEGLARGRRYPVAEDWPEDVFPLRKDWPVKTDKGEKQ